MTKCDVLSVTYNSVCNKDRSIIDSGCLQHISSDRKMFSYTSVQGGVVFMKNSVMSKVIGEGIIQLHSHDGCITTLQGVRHVPESKYNLTLLEPYMKKDIISILKVILWKFQKMPMWSFRPSVSEIFTCCKIRRLQLMDCSYPQLQDRRLWNNQRLQWFWARMFSFIPKVDWD